MAGKNTAGKNTAGKTAQGRKEVGKSGESIAARYLERVGYRIRERNYRCPQGEIDLIAVKDGFLVFVEVKTRTARSSYHPAEAVNEAKRRQVRLLGEMYYASQQHDGRDTELQPRFDVVAVRLTPSGPGSENEKVEHFIDAF